MFPSHVVRNSSQAHARYVCLSSEGEGTGAPKTVRSAPEKLRYSTAIRPPQREVTGISQWRGQNLASCWVVQLQ